MVSTNDKRDAWHNFFLDYILDTDDIITSSADGRIYVVRRQPGHSRHFFKTQRVIDSSSHLKSPQGQLGLLGLLNTMMGSLGNTWFTS